MSQKKNYMFTNRRHSEKAIMSTVFGVLCTVSLVIVVVLSYSRSGDVPAGYGFTGLFAAILSLVGMLLGVLALREADRFKLFGWLGILLNGVSPGRSQRDSVCSLLSIGLKREIQYEEIILKQETSERLIQEGDKNGTETG